MNVVFEWVMGSPTTQAGAIDVIAVRKPDGTMSCSPFHVKLSKVSKKGEKKVVKLRVNGKAVDLSMKLGPAGEAFFVERTRELPRRETPSASWQAPNDSTDPLSPRDAMSPREGTEETCSPLPVDVHQLSQRSSRDKLNSSQTSAVEAQVSSSVAGQDVKAQHGAKARPRSYSDGDAHHLHHLHQQPPSPAPRPSSTMHSMPLPEVVWVPQAEGAGLGGRRRARAASDMSELTGASQRAARAVDLLAAITAHSSSATLDGIAEGNTATAPVQDTGEDPGALDGAVEASVPAADTTGQPGDGTLPVNPEEQVGGEAGAEDGSGRWMWRWGTLPVKKKPKPSSGDLQGLNQQQPPPLPSEQPSSPGAPAPALGPKDSRGRAVSLPLMSALTDDGSGTAQRHKGRLGQRGRLHVRGPDDSFRLRVTAVESEIALGSAAEQAADFAAMFAAACADTSAFRALSLCGHLLASAELGTAESVQAVVAAHLVTPQQIAEGAVLLSDPTLVMVLGDYLLPLCAAERLLISHSAAAASSGNTATMEVTAEGWVTDADVAQALAAVREAGNEPLPAWAGRRISQWSDDASAAPMPLEPSATSGTLSGILTWQESFSDLVQAYRVQSIATIHSNNGGTSAAGTDLFAGSPLLQGLVAPSGQQPVSYRELWRRQQKSLATGSSFTALLTLDAGSSSSLYELGAWASNSEDHDGYGVGCSLHPERLSEASGSQHSLPMLISLEAARQQHREDEQAPFPSPTVPSPAAPAPSTAGATASYMRDAPFRSLGDQSYDGHKDPVEGGDSSQPSVCEEGDTDNDNLSLQDIDLDDISPEPAGGDFYDSDTDSYLSLSLEDGESGGGGAGGKVTFQQGSGGAGGPSKAGDGAGPRRRFKKYRYRKVLVPSQEQLELLDLQDGPNEIVFELDGCAPLKSTLFVWPADAKVVVTDMEGIFCRNQRTQNSGVWISFLGGGSYYSSNTASKTEFDSCIRLFAGLRRQGYCVIYLAQGAQSSGLSGSSLLSSQEYLSGIKATTGECLPAGPVFKSPDSLVRAFGAARTEVFKASALRGVKSLFSPSHNPYHACFCTREGAAVPFSRFGFPEGRIFQVSEKNEIRSANRTCVLTFPQLNELLHQIFPDVNDTIPVAKGSSAGSSSTKNATPPQQATESSAPVTTPRAAQATPTTVPPAGASTLTTSTAAAQRSVRTTSTDDTYNDFNFWKIAPAIIEDEY